MIFGIRSAIVPLIDGVQKAIRHQNLHIHNDSSVFQQQRNIEGFSASAAPSNLIFVCLCNPFT